MPKSKDEIVEILKSEINMLKLKPGDIVSEAVLTSRFNLSRTPIRDILKQLSMSGYINITPQKATRVSFIDLDSVEQIIYLRGALEKQILKDLAGNLTEKDIAKLDKILLRQREDIDKSDYFTTFIVHDDEFHKTLFSIAKKGFLWELIQSLNVHYVRYRRLYMIKKDKIEDLLKDHNYILKILKEGDPLKIEQFVNKHIMDDVKSAYFKENFSEYIS